MNISLGQSLEMRWAMYEILANAFLRNVKIVNTGIFNVISCGSKYSVKLSRFRVFNEQPSLESKDKYDEQTLYEATKPNRPLQHCHRQPSCCHNVIVCFHLPFQRNIGSS